MAKKSTTTTKERGGRRAGAGRRPTYGAAMIRKDVLLDPETIEFMMGLGGGNLSGGIREAATRLRGAAPEGGKP